MPHHWVIFFRLFEGTYCLRLQEFVGKKRMAGRGQNRKYISYSSLALAFLKLKTLFLSKSR